MNLLQIRKSRQLSQKCVARLCGIPATVISNFECGVRAPSLKSLYKLQRGLKCSWEDLLGK